MDESFQTKAIILKRQSFREADMRTVFFSSEFGRIDLVVRGAKKSGSKLVSYLEPLNTVRLMVVRGKQYDYVGGINYEEVFSTEAMSDLEKSKWLLSGLGQFDKSIKNQELDGAGDLYRLLNDYIRTSKDNFSGLYEVIYASFLFKLGSLLGYAINTVCPDCGKIISEAVLEPRVDNAFRCRKCVKDGYTFSFTDREWQIFKEVLSYEYYELSQKHLELVKKISHLIDYYGSCISSRA